MEKDREERCYNKGLVSIVIPHYNAGHYFIEMVDCIVHQTYADWELIIVDDYSTDNTIEILEQQYNDKRIMVRSRPEILPKGAPSCRNYGLSITKGEYVVFFDADDLISLDCLEKRVDYLSCHEELDFVVSPAQFFRDVGEKVKRYERDGWLGLKTKNRKKDFIKFLSNQYPFAVWTNTYRRESLKSVLWDTRIKIFQDFDFNVSCFEQNLQYDYLERNTADYFYRRSYSTNTISSNYVTKEKLDSTLVLFDNILNKLSLGSMDESKGRSYKTCFFRYVYFYFVAVLRSGDKTVLNEYLLYVGSRYGKRNAVRLEYIARLNLGRSNFGKLQNTWLDILAFLFFGDYFFLNKYTRKITKYLLMKPRYCKMPTNCNMVL